MDSIVKMGVKQNRTGPQESSSEGMAGAQDYEELMRLFRERESAGTGPETFGSGADLSGRQPGSAQRGNLSDRGRSRLPEPDPAQKAAARKLGTDRLAEQEKEEQRSLRKRYRLIAEYVIITVVVTYILLQMAGNLGSIVTTLGKAVRTVGLLLQPLFWGFVLAYILAPAVEFFEKKLKGSDIFDREGKSRRTPAVLITCLAAFLVVGALLSIVVSAITRSLRVASLEDLIALVQSFTATLQSFQQTIMNRISGLNISSSEVNSVLRQIGEKVVELTKGISISMAGTVGHIGGFLTSALFAVIFAIYFLLDGRGLSRYWNRVLLAVGGRKVRRGFHILAEDADAVFSGYVRGQLIDALIMAVLVSVSLSVIGVRYAVIIGVLSGIGNLIPYVGPVVAYASTIIVCLLTGDWRRLLISLVVLFIVQTVDGNIINPKLLSTSVDVHPMLVIIALIIGGSVGGFVGMLFAVPVAAFLRIQFDKVIDRLLKVRMPEKTADPRRRKRASQAAASAAADPADADRPADRKGSSSRRTGKGTVSAGAPEKGGKTAKAEKSGKTAKTAKTKKSGNTAKSAESPKTEKSGQTSAKKSRKKTAGKPAKDAAEKSAKRSTQKAETMTADPSAIPSAMKTDPSKKAPGNGR